MVKYIHNIETFTRKLSSKVVTKNFFFEFGDRLEVVQSLGYLQKLTLDRGFQTYVVRLFLYMNAECDECRIVIFSLYSVFYEWF